MSVVLNGVGWLLIMASLVYGYVLNNAETDIYLQINIVIGLIFIVSGVMGTPVDLYVVELSGQTFGIIYILISGVETYGKRKRQDKDSGN